MRWRFDPLLLRCKPFIPLLGCLDRFTIVLLYCDTANRSAYVALALILLASLLCLKSAISAPLGRAACTHLQQVVHVRRQAPPISVAYMSQANSINQISPDKVTLSCVQLDEKDVQERTDAQHCQQRLQHLKQIGMPAKAHVLDWSRQRFPRILADHLLRSGLTETASLLSGSAGLQVIYHKEAYNWVWRGKKYIVSRNRGTRSKPIIRAMHFHIV